MGGPIRIMRNWRIAFELPGALGSIDLPEKDYLIKYYPTSSDMGSFDQNGVFQYDELTKEEGDNFKKNIESIGSSYADALKGLDWLFPAADQVDKSLTASIQGVSEKTASALGGQINAIRVNAAETKDIVKQQLQHLASIDSNTHNSKNRLEDILKVLESMNSNSLRSEGL
jgi:hypothetical protein